MSTHKYLNETGLGQVWGKIKDLIPESDIFWINVTSTTVNDVTTYSADKTFTEIVAAYDNNKHCVLKNSQGVYSLETVTSTRVTFMMTYYSSFQRYFSTSVTINSSNVVTVSDAPFFTFTGSNNIYPRRDLIAQVNANFNSAPTTGNLTYSTTAYRAYSEGDLFWLSNTVLARATTDIVSGATLTENTNYVKTTIENEIKDKQPKRLVVTVTSTYDETTDEDTYSADKTFIEVQTAMNEGREVYFNRNGLSNQAYYNGPETTYVYADFPGNAHRLLIYSSNGIEIGFDYSYYRKADNGIIGGDLREIDEGTKIYQTAKYAHSKDDILWVLSDMGFDWGMYVAKNDIAVGDEFSTGNTGNLQAITVEDMIDMKIAAASSSISCATVSEIEEMCDALGFMSVVIDTSDYEVGE